MMNQINKKRVGLAILTGGIIGNVTDRFMNGAVIDFLAISYGPIKTPFLNVADICQWIGYLSIWYGLYLDAQYYWPKKDWRNKFFVNPRFQMRTGFLMGSLCFFTGFILLLTRIKTPASKLNYKNALIIGLFQAIALFPGISRSGMTISSAMFAGIEKEKAAKFSFLLFIPIVIGAMILEAGQAYFSLTLAVAFVISFLLSLIFLNILVYVLKKGYFWMFSVYCFILGIISLILYLFY